MSVGVARETKLREHRVSLAPLAVKALVQKGHRLIVENGAGVEAGHDNADYESAGATVVYSRLELFGRADLIVGVGAPESADHEIFRPGQVVLAFWALPTARPEDFSALQAREITAIATEAIVDRNGRAPVLTSMSEIAGGLAITIGGNYLLNEFGGKGILLSGAPGVPSADVVILGAGVLGRSAARAALGAGAQVTLLDVSVEHLRDAVCAADRSVRTLLATRPNIEAALARADLVLGAAAVRGRRAPVLVTRDMLKLLEPRSVIMDLAIDMGGCFETSRPTSFPHPAYELDGILHFCVPNIPSVVARSSTQALSNALLPYILQIADMGVDRALAVVSDLRAGAYLYRGKCVQETLARVFNAPLETLPIELGEQGALV
ncbi:MAG: alanine dehydrogenase [Vicinamibacteria bacterium]|nr:alanine dehydrogenase [Vicinamibacteria bacterium]